MFDLILLWLQLDRSLWSVKCILHLTCVGYLCSITSHLIKVRLGVYFTCLYDKIT